MITYGKTIFSTYTYSRDRLLDDVWQRANNDFNRYIQRLRRLHANRVQYLRTFEAHNDGYPHIHAILRFHTVLTITNGRYLDKTLYKRWKHLWVRGHSDFAVPRHKQSPIAYIIKYTTKNSGVNVWRKYYQSIQDSSGSVPDVSPAGGLARPVGLQSPTDAFVPHVPTPLEKTCKKWKIKQVTWSREFFKYLNT